MSFRITGLDPAPFRHLYGMTSDELARHGVQRCIADAKPGFPDRVELRDTEPGEALLLLNYTHQPADTPYRSSHAIFIREGAEVAYDRVDELLEPMRLRPISLRAFDAGGEMIDAELGEGDILAGLIVRLLANQAVRYIHAHYARRGCYAAVIRRA
jgi:hypothetical protein